MTAFGNAYRVGTLLTEAHPPAPAATGPADLGTVAFQDAGGVVQHVPQILAVPAQGRA
jgi:hypothetical protein